MKLKIQQIQGILSANIYDKPFPARASFSLARLAKTLTAELTIFDTERQKLIEKHNGTLNEDQTQYIFSGDDSTAFAKDMTELLETEIEVSFEPMSIEALGDVTLSPNDLTLIDPLLQD